MGLMHDGARRGEAGQMTVEFVAALPVLIIVAAIAVNAVTFFGECASFDVDLRDSTRTFATSPAYGQGMQDSCMLIEDALKREHAASNLTVTVQAHAVSPGLAAFEGKLEYAPTLFGLGLKSEVLGVRLPNLTHVEKLVVDCYKPGVLL